MEISKKIVIATPVLLCGGTEIQTLNLVRVLISAGCQVTVCCYYEIDDYVVDKFKDVGADVILLRLNRSDGRFGFSKILELIRKLLATFREYRPDIVHVQYLAPGLLPIIVARLANVPIVFATVHQPGRPYGLKAKILLRFGAYLCTVFFCVSKSAEESWFGNSEVFNPQHMNHKRKHYTIYNAVNVSHISQAVGSIDRDQIRKSMGLMGKHVVGIVGRLRKEKGHSVMLETMVEVVKEVPEAKLLVVGDGPDLISLKIKAESLGFGDHVVWLGAKEQEEVFQLYGIMDVVAVPSLFEGFGLTAAEAMAAGRPVVASDVDGLSEVVEDGVSGYLIPFGDTQALAIAIIRLIKNPQKAIAMGNRGQSLSNSKFSTELFAESINAVYLYFSRELF